MKTKICDRPTMLFVIVYIVLAVLDFVPLHFPAMMVFPLLWLTMCAIYKCQWTLAGALFFSFMGDVMGWQNEIIPQIGFFALAQILYIIIFTLLLPRNDIWPTKVRAFFLFVVAFIYLVAMTWIFPRVSDGVVSAGIAVYAVLLLGMCYSALCHRNVCLMAGATLFVASDFILGTHLFVHRFPHGHLLIMIPYYLGQVLLFLGVVTTNKNR